VAVVVSFKIPSKQLSSDNEKRHTMFGGFVICVAVTTEQIRVSYSGLRRR